MSERNSNTEKEYSVSNKTKARKADNLFYLTKFTHNNYTVGWICMLPKEQTTATAMLNQIHPDLPKPPHNHNTYTLGLVCNHKITIACLPKGKYSNNPAVTVMTQMVNTFLSIKVGLMVGIGNGIPPKVRLSNVVISTPVN